MDKSLLQGIQKDIRALEKHYKDTDTAVSEIRGEVQGISDKVISNHELILSTQRDLKLLVKENDHIHQKIQELESRIVANGG